ncbi:hypothetical protein L1D12_06940 [Vibrio parahaemolyticus]|uniref:hypothetical protein n=1 Tax=Vibrio parahaemolyticus TaxID=670 RepID=UPI001EFD0A35|nr:hypothetical protein [Vibrio parahaemolyticus]MCG9635038.1 hypothetical protein [Vibrio parahaemolyticus]
MEVDYKAKCRAEGLLVNALQRLLDGQPVNVKAKGRLTLNRVNCEAKLGNSYIYKFPDFVEYSKPIIAEFNDKRDKAMAEGVGIDLDIPLSEIENLKAKLNKSVELKKQYREQRDTAIKARKELEAENARLIYRLFELQQELLSKNGTVTPMKM